MAGWTVTDPPAMEPVSLDEIRNFVKQDEDEDNPLLEGLITAAREHVERVTRRCFIRRTVAATFDEWPFARLDWARRIRGRKALNPFIRLPLASPLIEVSKVEYTDLEGVTQELASTVYAPVTNKLPGRVRLRRNQIWPNTIDDEDAITITYDVGYGDDDLVPKNAKYAIMMLVAHWYDGGRTAVDVSVGGTVTDIPHGFKSLVSGLVVPKVA